MIIELFKPSVGLGIGLRGSATLTIHDNDAPTVKFGAATYRVVEGTPGAIVVTRDGGLGSPVTVDYQVTGGTATRRWGRLHPRQRDPHHLRQRQQQR